METVSTPKTELTEQTVEVNDAEQTQQSAGMSVNAKKKQNRKNAQKRKEA
jgi:hypothetical protein